MSSLTYQYRDINGQGAGGQLLPSPVLESYTWHQTLSVDKQCPQITSVTNFCYHHIIICYKSKKSISLPKLTTRIHAFWPCLKLHYWCFKSTSKLLSFCAPYSCKHKCLWVVCCYSGMQHIYGRHARRSAIPQRSAKPKASIHHTPLEKTSRKTPSDCAWNFNSKYLIPLLESSNFLITVFPRKLFFFEYGLMYCDL